MSSPVKFLSLSLSKLSFLANSLKTFVSAALKPVSCVPPSVVFISFAKLITFSEYALVYYFKK